MPTLRREGPPNQVEQVIGLPIEVRAGDAGELRREHLAELLVNRKKENSFALEGGDKVYDRLFDEMSVLARSGAAPLHQLPHAGGWSGDSNLLGAASRRVPRGRWFEPAGQLIEMTLYSPGIGAIEKLNLRRTESRTHISKSVATTSALDIFKPSKNKTGIHGRMLDLPFCIAQAG